MSAHCDSHGCSCCSSGLAAAFQAMQRAGLSRRNLLLSAGTAAVSSWAVTSARAQSAAATAVTDTKPKYAPADKLVIQPILTYALPQRREQTSWRPWGGIQTEAHLAEEVKRIETELNIVVKAGKLPLEIKPVAKVCTAAEAAEASKLAADVRVIYAAGGGRDVLDSVVVKDRPNIIFLRHRTGPVSLWYEILHPHFLRRATDQYADTGIDVNDVVVDEYSDVVWRLRGLLALRKTLGTRIVALGGALGWGAGRTLAPPIARDKWHLDIREVSYEDFAKKLQALQQNEAVVAEARKQADAYLKEPGVELHCDRAAVENAMVLTRAFKDLMAEHDAKAFTIGHCMGAVMPISKTTACVPLSILNDEGFLAFCESDFVVIPSGILMHHIMGTPVFLNDPTWPHHGIVTLAHCTAPRKMDGKNCERTKLYTHFESDYGAAPKVEMTEGTVVTHVIPDFECRKWVGATGKIVGNPFHDICRAQIDCTIDGDWQKLLQEMRGFHWMMVYGDCRKEVGYAIKHLGIEWEDVSA
ncbi:MAG TPA: sugar isomerase [Phycisphaerae bacterium]|mgnify:CR=1 FL=1|nr:sugar isomerase [Phycisphaerae bacterium]HOJ74280.1 sugar isomerase [Phycisphaerae bacterium]HOM51359.1 sugar isomerase [Phycisphaerae bacterium]HON65883.1 sugar isomerase [Phycisphaerae bacterium]HOQ85010.1 sugar isomerase [Phycisphaerae bacterium]